MPLDSLEAVVNEDVDSIVCPKDYDLRPGSLFNLAFQLDEECKTFVEVEVELVEKRELDGGLYYYSWKLYVWGGEEDGN